MISLPLKFGFGRQLNGQILDPSISFFQKCFGPFKLL